MLRCSDNPSILNALDSLRSRNALPRETTNYVPIILAMTIMAKNAKDYDLENIDADSPLEYDNLKLTSATHLALIADIAERPVSELRELNPALLTNVAPAGYELHVPKGVGDSIFAGLQSVPENRRASWRIHRVAQGDTMASIAKQYNTSPNSIAAANASGMVETGGLMLIPASIRETRTNVSVARNSKHSRMAAAHKPAVKRTARTSTRPVHRRASVSLVQTASLD